MTKSAPVSVGVHEAKTRLSELLRLVGAGREVEIRRNGEVVARLVGVGTGPRRAFGQDEGVFCVPDDFDAQLPDQVLDEFFR
ncbi:MAG: type II toxin-antitoxin system prevent-host-death family antitoxin [Jatrophihabitans sp.]|nr:MAG: type II toxin-antitoxin system prevent-host-death family antitoxin [Jatrophihabitans sp.]